MFSRDDLARYTGVDEGVAMAPSIGVRRSDNRRLVGSAQVVQPVCRRYGPRGDAMLSADIAGSRSSGERPRRDCRCALRSACDDPSCPGVSNRWVFWGLRARGRRRRLFTLLCSLKTAPSSWANACWRRGRRSNQPHVVFAGVVVFAMGFLLALSGLGWFWALRKTRQRTESSRNTS